MKNRVFVALNISNEGKKLLGEFSSELRKVSHTKASWIKPQNMHITLAFIGKIKSKKLETLIKNMSTIEFSPFKFNVNKISGFPNMEKTRVLWIGSEEKNPSYELYDKICSAINTSGISFDQKNTFIAHITLARMREKLKQHDISIFNEIAGKRLPIKIGITSLSVYESILSPQGAKYIELYHLS